MTQRRHISALEAGVNIIAGIAIQYVLGMTMLHWLGYEITLTQNLTLTAVMTVASFVRQYVIRRVFVYL
jgi:hypothetical protein